MLLAQGPEGHRWISHLPGHDQHDESDNGDDRGDDADGFKNASKTSIGGGKEEDETKGGSLCWCGGGVSGASLFERECDRSAKMIGRLFDAPHTEK